jgi:ABC-type glycerol-3-phosphate transport system permease component
MKYTRSENVFNVFNIIVLCFVSATMLYPFLNVLAKSFSGNMAIVRGEVGLFPVAFTFYGYEEIFKRTIIFQSLLNTVFITVAGTFLGLFLTATCAFSLSRTNLLGRKVLFFYFLFTMLFNGGLIPTFLIIKSLKLVNSLWALVLPQAFATYYMILMKNYFESVSKDLQDAATIDGCSDLMLFVKIMLPLSSPMLATLALFFAVIKWNLFTPALFYITDQNLFPIQVILRDLVFQSQFIETGTGAQSTAQLADLAEKSGSETLSMAVVIFSSVPILCVYPFLQKYFAKGIMLGSVKG